MTKKHRIKRNSRPVTIPKNVFCIGRNAFKNCVGLASVRFHNSVNQKLNVNSFIGSKYFFEYQRKRNRCPYCGGEFMGIFKRYVNSVEDGIITNNSFIEKTLYFLTTFAIICL